MAVKSGQIQAKATFKNTDLPCPNFLYTLPFLSAFQTRQKHALSCRYGHVQAATTSSSSTHASPFTTIPWIGPTSWTTSTVDGSRFFGIAIQNLNLCLEKYATITRRSPSTTTFSRSRSRCSSWTPSACWPSRIRGKFDGGAEFRDGYC